MQLNGLDVVSANSSEMTYCKMAEVLKRERDSRFITNQVMNIKEGGKTAYQRQVM